MVSLIVAVLHFRYECFLVCYFIICKLPYKIIAFSLVFAVV